jgi:protease IV
MKRFGKVVLWVIAVLVVVELVSLTVSYFLRRIPLYTVLDVRIEGDIPERTPPDSLAELTGATTTVTDIVEALDRARTDRRISGVRVRVGPSTMNMGKMQEIREKIREFNRSGKFSVAYLEFATNGAYYIASSCQTIILLPKSELYLHGLMAETTFFKGALDKLGIVADLYHIGDYKNATNVFTETRFTPAHREATQVLLNDWYGEFLRGVAEGRSLKMQDAESAIRKGPFTSAEALALKLVDRVAYADEAREFVKQKNHGSESRLGLADYLERTERTGRSKLAVIYATGTIVPGTSGNGAWGEEVMGSDTIAEQFRRAREDDTVKAVILRVNSPGGSSFSSEAVRRAVEITRRAKPVVVSMSDVAASGGYWIAMSADRIIAEPGTVTGSIGVFTGKLNLLGLFHKLGLTKDYVATTENSTLDWPFQNYTPSQRASVERGMRDIYASFIRGVAEGRHMPLEAVDKIAQGRVWAGERARQLGLVDELGGLDTAIAAAKGLARIPAGEGVALELLPPRKPLFQRVLQLLAGVRAGGEPASLRSWLDGLEMLAREPAWAVVPELPRVQ